MDPTNLEASEVDQVYCPIKILPYMVLYLILICIRRFFVSAVAKLELLRLNPGELCFVSPATSYFCLPDRSSTI